MSSHGDKSLPAFIDAVEKIAFEMRPPNPYTPRLVQLCNEARAALSAERRSDCRVVPNELTAEMLEAGIHNALANDGVRVDERVKRLYRCLLSAAPAELNAPLSHVVASTGETPRTDAEARDADGIPIDRVPAKFARQLERELAAEKEMHVSNVGYLSGKCDEAAQSHARLTKPAQVGNTIFDTGVEERLVIDRAHREYEYQQTPERQEDRRKRREDFIASVQAGCQECHPVNGCPNPNLCVVTKRLPTPDDAQPSSIGTPLSELVDRFLSWPLPESVCSDLCATRQGYPHRTGTNLLTAIEAKAMLEHVLKDVPLAGPWDVRGWWATAKECGGEVSHEDGWTLIDTKRLQELQSSRSATATSTPAAVGHWNGEKMVTDAKPVYWQVGWGRLEQRASGAIVIGSVSDEKTEEHKVGLYAEVTISVPTDGTAEGK